MIRAWSLPGFCGRWRRVKGEGGKNTDRNINIVTDVDGPKIALIHDIRFQSRKGIDWNEVEQSLKGYIGECFEISETSEKIYIGSDFPDEFSHSNDTKALKGANMKAKANLITAIGQLIQIATDKAEYPEYLFTMKMEIWNDIISFQQECL
jgi:hypothetical protein